MQGDRKPARQCAHRDLLGGDARARVPPDEDKPPPEPLGPVSPPSVSASSSPGTSPGLTLAGAWTTGRTPPGAPKNPLPLLNHKVHPSGLSSPNAFSLVSLTPAAASAAFASSSRPPSLPPADTPPLVLDFSVFLLVLECELPRPSAPDGLACGRRGDRVCARTRGLARTRVQQQQPQ